MWTNAARLGYIPDIINPRDIRPCKEQIAERYAHGGGYHEHPEPEKFTLVPSRLLPGQATLEYPGDQVFKEWGRCYLPTTRELVIVFDCALTAIVQADDLFAITRLD